MLEIVAPSILYGTAWKKGRTTELTKLALDTGFRAIDTANQLKHYDEAGVGEALRKYWAEGNSRDSVFLQTKFTSVGGQDHRLPYDRDADLTTQVRQSFESSLEHLGTDYLDSYLLHGPYGHPDLVEEDWEVWAAIEGLHREGRARYIGISNVNPDQLAELVSRAETKPHFVQNRCYAARGWDRQVRAICDAEGIRYQGFSLLTANPYEMADPRMLAVAGRLNLSPAQLVFALARHLGIVPLTGTSDRSHMELDLTAVTATLLPAEGKALERIAD